MEGEVSCILDRLPCDLLIVLVVEGKHARQEQVRDDTEGPVINLFSVGPLKENFGGDIRQRAEWVKAGLVWPDDFRKTEVDNLEICCVRVVCHQDIFWLEVPMGYTVRVKVVESSGDLVRQLLGACLRNCEGAFLQIAEQVSAIQLLHNDIDIILILEDIKKADNVRVLAHL